MSMRSIFVRILNLIKVRIIHPIIEFILRKAFFFCLLSFTPVFMTGFVSEIVLSFNWLMRVRIQKLTFLIFLSAALNLFTNILSNIGTMERHNQSHSISELNPIDMLKVASSFSRSKAVPTEHSR